MRIGACFILLFLCSFTEPGCIDLSHAKFISVNCNVSNCFRIIARCKYLKYNIYITNRNGKELLQYETKSGDIEELNTFMNNLRTTNDLESDTYFAKFSAFTYTDTTVRTFTFGLFKK